MIDQDPPPVPEPLKLTLSAPGDRYYRASYEVERFVVWLGTTVALHDYAATGLDTPADDFPKIFSVDPGNPQSARLGLIDSQEVLFEMLLVREVDNYLAYLVELLALVFESRPETLLSDKTVPVRMIIEAETKDEIIEAIVEKRVNELAYKSLDDLDEYVSSTLGFPIYAADGAREAFMFLVESRNAIVHNRSVVGRRFLQRIPDAELSVGDRVVIDLNAFDAFVHGMRVSVIDLDYRAAEHWSLDREPREYSGLPRGFGQPEA